LKQHEHVVNSIIEKSPKFQFTNKTILIVEDDIYNAEYLKEILITAGFNIIHSFGGAEAVKIAASKPVDLILMDIRLPDIGGYEATRQIKLQNPTMKIIAQTAYASHDEKSKAIRAGCSDYVSKPTKKEMLLSMLNKHLL
jgi:CheY-like chemotaxis protein